MNLTVAMKIIGGFTVISILLILTSVISLVNLNTIHESTLKQSDLAIPTLKGSNQLANELTQMGNLTLRGYYQNDLAPLSENKQSFESANTNFTAELKKLKSVVQSESALLGNLRKVDSVYNSFKTNVNDVFANRKTSIEQNAQLIEKVDLLEEKADDAATMLLDLADHDLADTKLQRAVSLGERIETLLNAMVSSAFEYRDTLDPQSKDIIEKEITNTLTETNNSINDVLSELNANGVDDVASDLESGYGEISQLISGDTSIFIHKQTQLYAIAQATEKLAAADNNTKAANDILTRQVSMANETTVEVTTLVAEAVSSGSNQTTIIMIISVIAAAVITRFTLISITRPLGRVNEMLNIVASGDLSHKLDQSGKDEFAELSRNCNTLIDSLRNLIQGIVSRSTQLAAAAEQTSAVTAQSTTAIEEQRKQVEQAASATTEMSSTSQSVLSSANEALGEIKQADDEAERVKGISEKNRETIELLANLLEVDPYWLFCGDSLLSKNTLE